MTRHHLPAKPGTVRWGHWDGSLPPVLTIRSGDTVTIDTLSGEPEDLPDATSGFTIIPGHREVLDAGYVGPGPHFLTGPIAIEGARPGDVLEVRIHEIELRQDWGWNLQVPLRGTLPEDFPELRRLHVPLDRKNNLARMPWGRICRSNRSSATSAWPRRCTGVGCRRRSRASSAATWTTRSWAPAPPCTSGLCRRRAVLGRRRPRPPGRRRGLLDRHRDRAHRHVRVHRAHRHEARRSRGRRNPMPGSRWASTRTWTTR